MVRGIAVALCAILPLGAAHAGECINDCFDDIVIPIEIEIPIVVDVDVDVFDDCHHCGHAHGGHHHHCLHNAVAFNGYSRVRSFNGFNGYSRGFNNGFSRRSFHDDVDIDIDIFGGRGHSRFRNDVDIDIDIFDRVRSRGRSCRDDVDIDINVFEDRRRGHPIIRRIFGGRRY